MHLGIYVYIFLLRAVISVKRPESCRWFRSKSLGRLLEYEEEHALGEGHCRDRVCNEWDQRLVDDVCMVFPARGLLAGCLELIALRILRMYIDMEALERQVAWKVQ